MNWSFIVISCTAVAGALIAYERKKSDKKKASAEEKYWSREDYANTVRRKDITHLDYIQIPLDELPFIETDDEELLEYYKTIRHLSEHKILNLTGFTNTDLKEQYGVANLTELSEYDENYTTLVNIITRWGARLMTLGHVSEAITVLEFGVSVGTDSSRNYYMLAEEYVKMERPDEIDRLIDSAYNIRSIMRDSILAKLRELRSYFV